MATFFTAVWLGVNRLHFDLIDAAATLDDMPRQLIADWLAAPIFLNHAYPMYSIKIS